MAPIGSQPNRIGLWQPVRLLARGDLYIEDVFVKTSVRKKEIEAEITVRNLGDKPRTAKLQAFVLNWPRHDGRPVLDFGKPELAVPAHSAATQILRQSWEKPQLWTPEHPVLYVLSVLSVSSAEGGKAVEGASARFGFREFWTDGPHLVLNGTRMKFLATAGHPRGDLDGEMSKKGALDFYQRIREAGCVAMRLHANVWPEWWYEAADEVGMPLIMESALFCNPQQYALTRPEFWKNYHDHLAAIIRAKRNHPSIVLYSLENEILHCGGEQFAKDCVHRLAEAGRMVKALDPTRPIMFEADGDPEGVADVFNLHYPEDPDANNLWPNCAWWLEKGMKVRGWPHTFFAWDRKKPLYIGEFLHMQDYQRADNYTTLLGDNAYRGHDWAMAHAKASAWAMQIEAYRGCDVSGMCPWTLTECGPFPSDDNVRYLAVKRAYQPIAAFIREYDTNFFAGETVTRTVNLYNDTLHPAKLTVEWELMDAKKTVDSGRREFDTQPAQRIPFTIQMKMPPPAGWNLLNLALRVKQGDRVVFEGGQDCSAVPRLKFGEFADLKSFMKDGDVTVALFDGPTRQLGQTLREGGFMVQSVTDLSKLPKAPVLVIGPHALDGMKPPQGIPVVGEDSGPRAALASFVREGGFVIVLEQDSYDCGLLPARLVDRGCTIAFTRITPLLRHRTAWPFETGSFWRGDHVIARKTIAKPNRGCFFVHFESGGPDGLVYLPLLQVMDGKGSYLLSQFLIGEKLDTEPLARPLLEALFLVGRGRGEREPPKLAVIQDKLRMTEMLDEIGVVYTNISGQWAKMADPVGGAILAEADAPELVANLDKVRRLLATGGTLILHAATPEGLSRLQKLFPEPLIAQPNTSVPVRIDAADLFTIEGLSNQDLYWYGDRSGLRWDDRTPLSAEVCDHVILGGLPDPKACQTFEAGKMAAGEGTPQFRGGEVYLYTNGSIKTAVDFPKDGGYAFVVRSKGTPVAGVYPQITVSVDGEPLGSVSTAGRDWGESIVTAHVEHGKHEVTLAFVNDAWDPEKGEDRNATLGWLRIGPVPPMKAMPVLNPPALVKVPLGGTGGFILLDQVRWDKRPGDERAMRYLSNLLTNLNCDFRSPVGVLTLDGSAFKLKGHPQGVPLPFSWREGVVHMGTNGTIATTVRFAKSRRYEFALRAEGTQAAGEFPNVALSLDGRKVGDFRLRRPGWHSIRLEAEVPAGEHEVGLSFTNDFYKPPEDRNVSIGGIEIR
jgi:beta-galactosidase